MPTAQYLNEIGAKYLPGYLGIVITEVVGAEVRSELAVREFHMAPNGYLHAGTVVTLARYIGGLRLYGQSAGAGCRIHNHRA